MKKMKIFFSYKLKKNYDDLCLIFKGKSNYHQNLILRKENEIKKINEQKREILTEELFKYNKYQRNFSCSCINSKNEAKINPIKLHFSNFVNFPLKTRNLQNDEKNIQFEDLIVVNNNYLKENKNLINSDNSMKNRKNERLSKIGENIIYENHKISNSENRSNALH